MQSAANKVVLTDGVMQLVLLDLQPQPRSMVFTATVSMMKPWGDWPKATWRSLGNAIGSTKRSDKSVSATPKKLSSPTERE
jgi:hypothetical protein